MVRIPVGAQGKSYFAAVQLMSEKQNLNQKSHINRWPSNLTYSFKYENLVLLQLWEMLRKLQRCICLTCLSKFMFYFFRDKEGVQIIFFRFFSFVSPPLYSSKSNLTVTEHPNRFRRKVLLRLQDCEQSLGSSDWSRINWKTKQKPLVWPMTKET